MAVGDSKSVRIEADDAYGQRHEQLVQEVDRSVLPDDLDPRTGMALQSSSPDGQVTQFMVTAVTDETITVDANHPLAGQALSFDIELVDIK
jgi:peptidylprolyl isomerase